MINFIKRKLAKRKLMSTYREFDYDIKSYELEGVGKIDFAYWQNPFAYPPKISENNLRFFSQFINSGDFAIDIGANVGDTAYPMALVAGKEGLVLALEPNPLTFKVLQTNATLNPDHVNIKALPYAATEEDGDFFYNSSEATFNNGGVSATQSKKHGAYELASKIKGINLKNYLNEHHENELRRLSLIKVDTEGYDKDILYSLASIITTYTPVVLFECFKKLTPKERHELYDFFIDRGYELFHFDDFDITTNLIQLTKNDMMRWRHFEVMAKPAED